MTPHKLLFGVGALFVFASTSSMDGLLYAGQDLRTIDGLLVACGFVAAILLGYVAATFRRREGRHTTADGPQSVPGPGKKQVNVAGSLDRLAVASLIGYVAWFSPVVLHPGLLFAALSGGLGASAAPLRDQLTVFSGAKGLTQAAVVYAAVWSLARWQWDQRNLKRHNQLLVVLLAFSLIRTLAWAERLAFIEFVLPIAACAAFRYVNRADARRSWKLALSIGPAAAPLFFAVTEYFRSWSYYRQYYESYPSYISERFGLYFAAALNNGQGLQSSIGAIDIRYDYPWNSILSTPFFGDVLRGLGFNNPLPQFLYAHGDRQFNTVTGVFPYVIALGIPAALILAFFFGALLRALFTDFVHRVPSRRSVLFVITIVGLAEIPLIAYFSEPRYFAEVVFLMLFVSTTSSWGSTRRPSKKLGLVR